MGITTFQSFIKFIKNFILIPTKYERSYISRILVTQIDFCRKKKTIKKKKTGAKCNWKNPMLSKAKIGLQSLTTD